MEVEFPPFLEPKLSQSCTRACALSSHGPSHLSTSSHPFLFVPHWHFISWPQSPVEEGGAAGCSPPRSPSAADQEPVPQPHPHPPQAPGKVPQSLESVSFS